jgi:hypothetical protein
LPEESILSNSIENQPVPLVALPLLKCLEPNDPVFEEGTHWGDVQSDVAGKRGCRLPNNKTAK